MIYMAIRCMYICKQCMSRSLGGPRRAEAGCLVLGGPMRAEVGCRAGRCERRQGRQGPRAARRLHAAHTLAGGCGRLRAVAYAVMMLPSATEPWVAARAATEAARPTARGPARRRRLARASPFDQRERTSNKI